VISFASHGSAQRKTPGIRIRKLRPLPPTNNGHPWTIGDILVGRRDQIRRLEAAQQK
jgi:hypothetical protein